MTVDERIRAVLNGHDSDVDGLTRAILAALDEQLRQIDRAIRTTHESTQETE